MTTFHRSFSLHGAGCSIVLPRARSLDVIVDPTGQDAHGNLVRVEASGEDQAEIDRLTVKVVDGMVKIEQVLPRSSSTHVSGGNINIFRNISVSGKVCAGDMVGGQCIPVSSDSLLSRLWGRPSSSHVQESSEPTLAVRVTVAPATSLTFDGAGAIKVCLGDGLGAVALDLSGDVSARVGHVTRLTMDVKGSACVDVDDIKGDVQIDASGSGKSSLHRMVGSLSLDLRGDVKVFVKNAIISSANINALGSCTVRVAGSIEDASVKTAGACTVRLAKVSRLHKASSGSSKVVVG